MKKEYIQLCSSAKFMENPRIWSKQDKINNEDNINVYNLGKPGPTLHRPMCNFHTDAGG